MAMVEKTWLAKRARQAISVLDLTSLNDKDDEAAIEALCERAKTPLGNVAAVCVWPRFVGLAKRYLENTSIRCSAVANFPAGSTDIESAMAETKQILANGGDEVDVVFPYRAFMEGDKKIGHDLVRACKEACGKQARLKVILETGALEKDNLIFEASQIAIKAGADFIKTSTGKIPQSATLEAARIMLRAIKESDRSCGLKVSGGIRDAETAASYLNLVAETMGESWISPTTFRFGASAVLENLIAAAQGQSSSLESDRY